MLMTEIKIEKRYGNIGADVHMYTVQGGGGYTVAEDWITERGGAAWTISFLFNPNRDCLKSILKRLALCVQKYTKSG